MFKVGVISFFCKAQFFLWEYSNLTSENSCLQCWCSCVAIRLQPWSGLKLRVIFCSVFFYFISFYFPGRGKRGYKYLSKLVYMPLEMKNSHLQGEGGHAFFLFIVLAPPCYKNLFTISCLSSLFHLSSAIAITPSFFASVYMLFRTLKLTCHVVCDKQIVRN